MTIERFVKALLAVAVALSVTGCDSVGIDDGASICGRCGTIQGGDVTISGEPVLDGIFKAVGDLDEATRSIRAGFETRVKNLAEVFAIDSEGRATADLIAEIKTEFNAQINANLQGGLEVDYKEADCSADMAVAARASAQCQVASGCDVDVNAQCDPGELSFACEGKCTGGCTAGCEGTCTAKVEGQGGCSGTCSGFCDLSVSGGTCEGTCKGECSGTCSLENASGECEGECQGTCTGSCEMPSAGGSCSGECKGQCTFEVTAEAECEGKCEGSCSGECTGGCEGSFEPPSCDAEASASCEASADCGAQAEARGAASLKCTPPTINFAYEFAAGVDASAQAEIMAKLEAFKVEMVGVVQGMAELKGLIEGNAELDIEPPVVTIGYAIDNFVDGMSNEEFEIPPGRMPCVIPAFEESANLLVNLGTDMQGTILGQLELFELLGIT